MGTVGYLLDTCTFLWSVRGSQKLSDVVKNAIDNTSIPLFLSSVSAFEITNKYRLGKLHGYEDIAENYFEAFQKLGADELSLNMHHTHFAGKFGWEHRDPFDRLLAAQASIENLTLLTSDPVFKSLPWVTVLW
jgi:PIN domain nuclease of toxin-antitoxin system